MIFLVFLLKERTGSSWREYFDSLPLRASSPLYFHPSEMGMIEGTPLERAVEAKKRKLEKERESLNSCLMELGEKSPLPFPVSLEDFFWADTMFRSRVFGIPAAGAVVFFPNSLITLISYLSFFYF